MNTPQSPAMVEVDRLPELPDQYEAAAHMFPVSLAEFKERETTDTAYSIPVGSPDDGKSVPLWTSDQMRAYATEAIAAQRAEVVRLSAEVERLRLALEWYSVIGSASSPCGLVTIQDAGKVARAALATTTQGEKS